MCRSDVLMSIFFPFEERLKEWIIAGTDTPREMFGLSPLWSNFSLNTAGLGLSSFSLALQSCGTTTRQEG